MNVYKPSLTAQESNFVSSTYYDEVRNMTLEDLKNAQTLMKQYNPIVFDTLIVSYDAWDDVVGMFEAEGYIIYENANNNGYTSYSPNTPIRTTYTLFKVDYLTDWLVIYAKFPQFAIRSTLGIFQ